MNSFKRITLVVLLFCLAAGSQVVVRRDRNEGTASIPATNVMGNGNITVAGVWAGNYRTVNPSMDPGVGVAVGIADILQITGNMFFTNFKGLGSSDMSLQLTTPGNDDLRFFGIAGAVDLHLSTTEDPSTSLYRPGYDSYFTPSLTIDIDWLSHYKALPLKTYFNAGLSDDPDLLSKYDQIGFKSGVEWKTLMNSFFLDVGLGLYKEKENERQSIAGDNSYQHQVVWLEPGVRYHVGALLSLLGSLRLRVTNGVKTNNPVNTDLFKMNVGFEFPLIFKETNTEAIRTLVFQAQRKSVRTPIDSTLQATPKPEQTPEVKNESDILKKREEIQKKMDDIEKILEDIP